MVNTDGNWEVENTKIDLNLDKFENEMMKSEVRIKMLWVWSPSSTFRNKWQKSVFGQGKQELINSSFLINSSHL
jgi:hypothetical protein